MDFLLTIIIILSSAQLLGWAATKVGLPTVIGQLAAGLLVGPAMLNWVHLTVTIQNLANLGVIMLMFLAGLHSDIHLLKKYLAPSLVIAILGIIIPVLTITSTGMLLGWNLKDASFLGLIFGATSVSITVAVLKEMHQLRSKEGSTILGAAVADDIITVIMLGLLVTLAGVKLGHQITSQLGLGTTILIQIAYLFGVYWLAIKVIIPVWRSLAPQFTYLTWSMLSLLLGLVLAEGAELVGLSAITGAFFAGLAINATPVKNKIDNSLNALGNLFLIPIFFVSIGLELNWQGIIDDPGLIVILLVLAVLGKLIGAGLGAKLTRFSNPSALVIGAGMVSRGEVGLIIAQLVFNQHLLNDHQYAAIVAVLIISTMIAPVILRGAIKRQHQGKRN